VRACVALLIKHPNRMRLIMLPIGLCYIFPHYLKKATVFEEQRKAVLVTISTCGGAYRFSSTYYCPPPPTRIKQTPQSLSDFRASKIFRDSRLPPRCSCDVRYFQAVLYCGSEVLFRNVSKILSPPFVTFQKSEDPKGNVFVVSGKTERLFQFSSP
jgi:hypothetical protein